jgi:flagellar biosynthesis/type III secretory pathway chaperone
MDINKTKIFYFQITDVWKRHCELHSELFDLTCDEYALLLDSNIDDLEKKVDDKNNLIEVIKANDEERSHLISKLTAETGKEVKNAKDVIELFADFQPERESKHLFRFNELLIDIISKIQDQNKKNQLFINKAINSLRQIREDATGTKTISTYNAKGVQQSRTLDANA